MHLSIDEIKKVSENISNYTYNGNIKATTDLVELFDKISKKSLKTWQDYVKMYDDNFYTYQNWEDLIQSEKDQSNGWTSKECFDQLNKSIWKLPCGWLIQYV